ncbi:hypothetical protein SAMN04488156_102382 [Bacillus sp. 166amftsu]|nr:hypothetical protein SAMN04488156_102382 [Bacillus sp. 166amftsu]
MKYYQKPYQIVGVLVYMVVSEQLQEKTLALEKSYRQKKDSLRQVVRFWTLFRLEKPFLMERRKY